MMERQRTLITTYADTPTILALGTGLLLGSVLWIGAIENTSVLFIAMLYIGVGVINFGIRQTRPESFRKIWSYLILSLTHAIALLVLPTISPDLLHLWIGIAGFSVIPMLIANRLYTERELLLIMALPIVGAVVGSLIGFSADRAEVFLGLGLLVIGSLAAYFTLPMTQSGVMGESALSANQAFTDDLRDLAMRMHVTVEELVSATQAINSVTIQQSSGASEQADVIKLTNSLLDDFLQLSESIKSQAHSVQKTAQQTSDISQQGQTSLSQAINGMEDIRKQVSAIGQTITRLAQLTQRIDDIITSVSEIATQSNLLALNASIEAARAGVHGRGFAVVADEVRTLAQQSTQSAAQVRAILVEIQQAMKETVRATQVGMEGVVAGSEQTREANNIMIQLAGSVDASHHAVESIYYVIRQQVEGLEEISISIERINRITQQNLASTRTVEMVSTNLTRLSHELQAAVDLSQGLKTEQVGN